MLQRVIVVKKEQLVSALSILILLTIIAACLLYYAENQAQPEVFTSIPAAMWWAVSTLTTVGYGDIYPVTPVGKIIASVIAILGIGMFALPTAIIGAGFIQEAESRKDSIKCPHCGKDIASYKNE
jgi:voltage-gated potassium channel